MNSKCEFFIVKLVLFMLLFVFNNVAIAQISKIKTVQEETFEQLLLLTIVWRIFVRRISVVRWDRLCI